MPPQQRRHRLNPLVRLIDVQMPTLDRPRDPLHAHVEQHAGEPRITALDMPVVAVDLPCAEGGRAGAGTRSELLRFALLR